MAPLYQEGKGDASTDAPRRAAGRAGRPRRLTGGIRLDPAAAFAHLTVHVRKFSPPVARHHDPLGPQGQPGGGGRRRPRSEEHTSELQSLMRNSYAVFCLKKKKQNKKNE